MGASVSTEKAPKTRRLMSLDALRGLAIVGMLLVDNRGSQAMPSQFIHSTWSGLHIADVVFPLFLFALGMSMALTTKGTRFSKVIWRAAKMVILGTVLVDARYRSLGPSTGVLQHIAAAYIGCWLLMRLPRKAQTIAAGGILAAVWAAYQWIPVPGHAGGWAAGQTIGEWFTVSVLHMHFSAEAPQVYLPSIVTVYLGILAVRALGGSAGGRGLRRLGGLAAALTAAGLAMMPIVPLNKALWTPSYVLVTGGIATALVPALSLALDRDSITGAHLAALRGGIKRLGQPLLVLGRNAIVVFAFSELVFRAVLRTVQPQIVGALGAVTGPVAAAIAYGVLSVAAALWLCTYMEHHGLHVTI